MSNTSELVSTVWHLYRKQTKLQSYFLLSSNPLCSSQETVLCGKFNLAFRDANTQRGEECSANPHVISHAHSSLLLSERRTSVRNDVWVRRLGHRIRLGGGRGECAWPK